MKKILLIFFAITCISNLLYSQEKATTENKCSFLKDEDGRGKWFSIHEKKITFDELLVEYRECMNFDISDSISISKIKKLTNGNTRYTLQQFKSGIKVENSFANILVNNGLVEIIENNVLKIKNLVKYDNLL